MRPDCTGVEIFLMKTMGDLWEGGREGGTIFLEQRTLVRHEGGQISERRQVRGRLDSHRQRQKDLPGLHGVHRIVDSLQKLLEAQGQIVDRNFWASACREQAR